MKVCFRLTGPHFLSSRPLIYMAKMLQMIVTNIEQVRIAACTGLAEAAILYSLS